MTQPLEPLYTLRVAAEMIPYPGSYRSLIAWLHRRRDRFPIRHQRRNHSWVRLLTLSELATIRSMLVKEIPPSPMRVTERRLTHTSRPSGGRSTTA